jgi:hypothetical protein
MRLKVHQLRIALIVANLILAGSAAAYAFTKYKNLTVKPESVKIINPKDLVIKEKELQPSDPTGPLRGTPDHLIPRKPPEVTDQPPVDPTKDPDNPVDGPNVVELGPGPLGEHWEYAFYILCEGDPMNSVISLRKKDAAGAQPGAAAAASKQGGVRPRSQLRPQRVNLSQRKPAGGLQPAGDSLTFTVGQRLYKNDSVDPPVEFYIHEADRQKFVYWVPADGPQKKYALPRESHSLIYMEPELGLRPQPPPEGTEEEGKAKRFFIERPAGWEDKREDEYLRMLNGEPAGPNIKLTGPQEAEKKEKETGSASKKPVPSFGGKEPRKTFTDEEKEQLREVMKSPKMSEKDRAELRKAFMGAKK